jgi:hypothetical protein
LTMRRSIDFCVSYVAENTQSKWPGIQIIADPQGGRIISRHRRRQEVDSSGVPLRR